MPIPPPALPVGGGGINVGSGTQYPILYPIAELGNQGNSININLSSDELHYQKLVIDASGTTTITFDGLILDRAIVFTLDVSIGISGVTAVNWPARIVNLPSGLPITNGSRYILYLTGFRDGTEERYNVVNTSIGGSGTLWSAITIDVNKDMGQHNLTDLSSIAFGQSDGKLRQIAGPVGTGMTFDLGTAALPLSGEKYYFKNSNVEIFRIEAQDVLSSVSIYPSTSALNLGDNSSHLKWQNIFLSNRAFIYEGSTGQYLQIFKSATTHAVNYDIEDLVNTNPTHSFFVNGGAALFSIVANDSVYSQLDVIPTTNVIKSLGATPFNRWKNLYLGGTAIIYENTSTSAALEINKDTISHDANYNLIDSGHTSAAHLFLVNGGDSLFSIAGNDSNYSSQDLVPTVDNRNSLGAITFNRWKNLHYSGRINAYEGISTSVFAEIYKSTSIHDLTFNVIDASAHVGYSFFVNGGVAVFQIQGSNRLTDKISVDLDFIPLTTQARNLGNSANQWQYFHTQIENIYEAGSTSKFLQITKNNSNHYVVYDFNDTVTGVGHLFTRNGNLPEFQFAIEDDGIFFGQVEHQNVKTVSGTYVMDRKFGVIFADASGGSFTITLPAISIGYPGEHYYIMKVDSSTFHVTVQTGSGSDTINGSTSVVLSSQYNKLNILSNAVHLWGSF